MPKASATIRGAWLGSMIPPAPTRIVEVPAATWRNDHRGRGAGNARHVVMLGEPVAAVAEALGVAGEITRVRQRLRRVAAFQDRRKIENREGHHVYVCAFTRVSRQKT